MKTYFTASSFEKSIMNLNQQTPYFHARSGPDNYIQGSGVLQLLPEYEAKYKHAAVVTGENSFHAFRAAGGDLRTSSIHRYDGTVSLLDIERLSNDITRADLVIAIGGGRVCDTAKSVAARLHSDLITVPTIAATCAAYSSHTVLYDEHHVKSGFEQHDRSPLVTLVDTALLNHAPVRYLLSGIGDSLAKWYEAESIMRGQDDVRPTEGYGLAAAQEVRDVLVKDAVPAIEANRRQTETAAFSNIIEAIFPLSGSVGGFADKKGRSSGAHAIANALTSLPNSDVTLHGEKVAYGILVLLDVLHQDDEVQALREWYTTIGLPVSLDSLELHPDSRQLEQVAETAASNQENFVLAVPDITAQQIISSINRIERFSTEGNQ